MPQVILAIDQGTTGTTVFVVDARGRIRGRAYAEIRQFYPKPGWVEHDPEEIYRSVVTLSKKAIAAAEGFGRRDRGNRHHQSTRDVRGVGAAQRAPCLSRDRVAMPPQRRYLRRLARARARSRGANRPAPRSVFLRHQAQMAARRETANCASAARAASCASARSTPGWCINCRAARRS